MDEAKATPATGTMTLETYRILDCPHCASQVSVLSGRWARAIREAAGLSLNWFAQQLGVSAQFLSQVELGRRPLWPGNPLHERVRDAYLALEDP